MVLSSRSLATVRPFSVKRALVSSSASCARGQSSSRLDRSRSPQGAGRALPLSQRLSSLRSDSSICCRSRLSLSRETPRTRTLPCSKHSRPSASVPASLVCRICCPPPGNSSSAPRWTGSARHSPLQRRTRTTRAICSMLPSARFIPAPPNPPFTRSQTRGSTLSTCSSWRHCCPTSPHSSALRAAAAITRPARGVEREQHSRVSRTTSPSNTRLR
eukprot:Amastigsp_a339284_112.p2 type:complete len:216 gc:universal Amastigsp_a339284_112:2229-1582(-)